MVEKAHTAGWWPNLYEPLRGIGEKVADWFAPRSEASAAEGTYDITLEAARTLTCRCTTVA
jgi:HSP20 family protein